MPQILTSVTDKRKFEKLLSWIYDSSNDTCDPGWHSLGQTVEQRLYDNACVYAVAAYYGQQKLEINAARSLTDLLNHKDLPDTFFATLAPRLSFEDGEPSGCQPLEKLRMTFADACQERYFEILNDEKNHGLMNGDNVLGWLMARVEDRVLQEKEGVWIEEDYYLCRGEWIVRINDDSRSET